MLIIDYSQISLSSFFALNARNEDVDESFLRHCSLNSIRSIRSRFRDYGEAVIAIDSANSWRKTIFPYYKAHRKKSREDSGLDWNMIYKVLNEVKEELRAYFPYKVIEVENTEADDIIGTLAQNFSFPLKHTNNAENVLIISADKDFIQLQKYANVQQYNPIAEKYVTGDGVDYLFEHILKGDKGDGIPSHLSQDSTFVEGIRQKPLTTKRIEYLKSLSFPKMKAVLENDGFWRYYERNRICIDLSCTPENLQKRILEEYQKEPNVKSPSYDYFIKHKLRILFDHIHEF